MSVLDIRPTREYWDMKISNSKIKVPEKITYKTRPIRLSDEVWELLKNKKIESGKSWNLFIKSLTP